MIAVLTQCFPSRIGGIESLISNLSLCLSDKHKVVVFADRHHLFFDAIYDHKVKKKLIIRRTGGIKFFRRRRKIREFKLLLSSGKISCVIADSWKSLELCSEFLVNKKVPTICLAHGNELLNETSKKNLKVFNVLNNTNVVVANSDYTLNLVKKIGLKRPIVKKIHPGAENIFEVKETEVKNIKGSPIVLTLARLEKRKGHKYILNCLEKLVNKFENLQYLIAGEGPELTNLKAIVSKKKLNNNVVFLGKINDSQKKYIFKKTDLMVMPTIDESVNKSIEGFGISYIEAALFGIPSIASNVGGTSEAVIHYKTGIILNHIDELEQNLNELLENDEKRIKLGEAAKKRAINDLQWDKVKEEYFSLISTISKI